MLKSNKRNTWVAALFSICLMSTQPALAGGIPVFDGAAVAQAIQQGIQMKEQIENQIKQIEQLKKQAEALRGMRNLGTGSVSSANFTNELPKELRELYKNSGLSVKGIKDGKSYAETVQNSENMLIGQMKNMSNYLVENKKRLNTINQLTALAAQAQDMKAAADLQNQIAGYSAQLQTQQAEIAIAERLYNMHKEVEKRQYQDKQACYSKHIIDRNFAACN